LDRESYNMRNSHWRRLLNRASFASQIQRESYDRKGRPVIIKCLASLTILLCVGCTQFAHGVVDKPMPNDVRLVGYWEELDDSAKAYIRVIEVSPTSLRIDITDREKCKTDGPMMATRTEINGMSFLDITIPRSGDSESLVFPIDYEIDDHGQILVGGHPPDVTLELAIDNHELPGRIVKSKSSGTGDKSVVNWGDRIYVDASMAELRQFMAVHAGPTAKPPMVFRRPPSAILPCQPDTAPWCSPCVTEAKGR